jgi:[ribosomal protein S5]-alanine N-acetyltransferase
MPGTLAGVDHILTTERLALRPVTAGDHAVLLAHWTQPEVRRFLFDGAAPSAAEVTETIQESIRDFAAGGHGIWLIQEAEEMGLGGPAPIGPGLIGPGLIGPGLIGPGLIGTAGLRPLDDLGLEIFSSLVPASWSRGYATEAARAVVAHALGTLGLPVVLAEVDEGNAASVGVVKRLGMTPFAVVPGALGPMIRYRTVGLLAEIQ